MPARYRKTGRMRNRPPATMATMMPNTSSARCQGAKSVLWADGVRTAPFEAARKGNIARIGITAMSWNNRTEKEVWPPLLFIKPFSFVEIVYRDIFQVLHRSDKPLVHPGFFE